MCRGFSCTPVKSARSTLASSTPYCNLFLPFFFFLIFFWVRTDLFSWVPLQVWVRESWNILGRRGLTRFSHVWVDGGVWCKPSRQKVKFRQYVKMSKKKLMAVSQQCWLLRADWFSASHWLARQVVKDLCWLCWVCKGCSFFLSFSKRGKIKQS